jgi:hypothetical protein
VYVPTELIFFNGTTVYLYALQIDWPLLLLWLLQMKCIFQYAQYLVLEYVVCVYPTKQLMSQQIFFSLLLLLHMYVMQCMCVCPQAHSRACYACL